MNINFRLFSVLVHYQIFNKKLWGHIMLRGAALSLIAIAGFGMATPAYAGGVAVCFMFEKPLADQNKFHKEYDSDLWLETSDSELDGADVEKALKAKINPKLESKAGSKPKVKTPKVDITCMHSGYNPIEYGYYIVALNKQNKDYKGRFRRFYGFGAAADREEAIKKLEKSLISSTNAGKKVRYSIVEEGKFGNWPEALRTIPPAKDSIK